MAATISVIIPAYNQGQYLAQAIRSVLDQSFADVEIIVVNDGSTDNTAAVAASFSDPRVRVIHQANKGLSGARNSGLLQASSPWVLFLDADDWLLPGALAAFWAHHQAELEAGVIVGGWEKHNAEGFFSAHQPSNKASFSLPGLLFGNSLPVHSALVARKFLGRVGLFDEKLAACEDWDLWLRLLLDGCVFSPFAELVCGYRIHNSQMTRQALRMRTASLAVLDKMTSETVLSQEVRDALPKAYALVFLRAAAREYREGLEDQAREDMAKAVELYPPLLDDEMIALARFFRGWANDPATADPADYLNTVYTHLPPALSSLAERRSKEIGLILIQAAFEKYQKGESRTAGALALKAIRSDPTYLTNRGVLSILGRSGIARLLIQ